MARKPKIKKNDNSSKIILVLVLIVGLVLLGCAVAMLSNYEDEVIERTSSKAQYNTLVVQNDVKEKLNYETAIVISVASRVSELENTTDAHDYVTSLLVREDFSDVISFRFYKDNNIYNINGLSVTGNDPTITRRQTNPDAGYVGCFEVEAIGTGTISVMGFYAPISSCSFYDGITMYIAQSQASNFFNGSINTDQALEFSCMVKSNGLIVAEEGTVSGNQLVESLHLGDTLLISKITEAINNGTPSVYQVRYNNVDCTLSISSDPALGDFRIVEMYRTDELYDSSLQILNSIVAIIVIFAVINIAYIVSSAIKNNADRKRYLKLETYDEKLEAKNRTGFEKESERIIAHNTTSMYFVIVLELRHFKYLQENFGESEVNNLLVFFNTIIKNSLRIEECSAHLEGGEFLMLLREKSKDELIKRLKSNSFILTQYKGADKFDINLCYGIYGVDKEEKLSVNKMIDYAKETINENSSAALAVANAQYFFYSDELRKIRMQNENIELRMDSALQNGEFQVFYQPKYNLNTNQQDGAEALVRWYDKKSGIYNPPSLFLSLFESNGFIIKLDKYIYKKVCENLSYSIASGRRVFSVSVNVSRLTATQQDFIRYYSKIKRDYNIPDGLIMIEFTESFAFDNYEELKRIIDALHKEGLKCSLDDFGSGHSSYRTLKELPIDEVKLDKLFLDKGYNIDRDDTVLKSIISLSKTLGIKVTQEGAEEQSEVDRMRRLGCDVIQGYIYSKPISLSDYYTFVQNTNEHKLK